MIIMAKMNISKRPKAEKLIYDVFSILDPTGTNTKRYREIFSNMPDTEFIKLMTNMIEDDTLNFVLDVVDFERDVDLVKAKTEMKRKEAAARKEELAPKIRPLYGKAIEYIKTCAIDPVVECGYTPWSKELTERVNAWLDKVLALQDPQADVLARPATVSVPTEEKPEAKETEFSASTVFDDGGDLPF